MKIHLSLVFALAANLMGSCSYAASNDIVIGDFEGSDHGDWTTIGTAFGNGPALGTRTNQLQIGGVRGNGAASSEFDGDKPQGRLTSPIFKIERNYISFLIGGGVYEHHTCLNLLVDGHVVHSATGANSDNLKPVSWNVKALMGKNAQIEMVDEASGDWGHINVDHIMQTNAPERLPVATQPLYHETFRPQVHFTARQWTVERLNPGQRQEGWLNDLNGMIYYDGEYHLFAQRWNKCWIHAISKDLIHWTELEPAFWEESLDSAVQSGTCVIDYGNTSGLSPDSKNPAMVAFWTRNRPEHGISYSLDHGRTWQHYAKNPILVKPERDPKVFWYAPQKHWVMIMYGEGKYHVLTSPNLTDWTDVHKPIDHSFECPDFFQLPIDNDKNNTKWVLVRADGRYSLGTFDGEQFTEETTQFDSDAGPNFYATQTFNNVETGDGRRIQCAWMRSDGIYPDMPFNQQVTFPCLLTLRTTPEGVRMFREPIPEIARLHTKETKWKNRTVQAGETLPLNVPGDLFHIKMSVSIPEGSTLSLNVKGVPVALTHNAIANGTDPVKVRGELKTVEIIIDRTSIEVFGNNGEVSSSRCCLGNSDAISLVASGDATTVDTMSVWELESAWKGNTAYDAGK
ncbi:levanase [Abditibacteriota bacterium]|nr:levanase [Abditibacteriota bacterium]